MDPIIEQLKGKLIVSCQAYMGEPLRHPETMAQMARACELGGAGGIRCQGLSDISAIKGRTEVPVIGKKAMKASTLRRLCVMLVRASRLAPISLLSMLPIVLAPMAKRWKIPCAR